MVNFDKLGARAGTDRYPTINEDWDELTPNQRNVIRAIVKYPEKSQTEISKLVGVNPVHVHSVIYALPPEEFSRYKTRLIEEADISLKAEDQEVNDDDTITVSAPMRMLVEVSIPRKDLETATTAAISQDAIVTGVETDDID